jgi:hypothetical protein
MRNKQINEETERDRERRCGQEIIRDRSASH